MKHMDDEMRDSAFDVALDAAEIRLTCGHCRREPATHVLVAWCGAPVQKRICEVVCEGCGDYSLGLGSDFLGCVQMYPVQLVEPRVEADESKQEAMDVIDSLLCSIWLHGDWRWLTQNMTTVEKEAAASCVERHWERMEAEDPRLTHGAETRAYLRWWR